MNKGRQTHQLSWTTEGFSPFCRYARLPAIGNTKGKDSSQSAKPACPVFNLRPPRMELKPGKSMVMTLEGFSSTPQVRSPARAEPSPSDLLHWGFFCSPLSFAWENEQVLSRSCLNATSYHGSTSCSPCWPPSVAKGFFFPKAPIKPAC